VNIKERMNWRRHEEEADRGDLVQTVLLVAGFAIIAILIVTWIGTAILNKGNEAASCIQGASTYSGNLSSSENACSTNTGNTYQNDAGYKSRFGNG
jgi:hypothetical protein